MIDAVQETRFASEPSRRIVWLPRNRMVRYQWAKVIGAAFFVAIFAGWLFIQWSNPLMRTVAAALLLLTAWLTVKSIITDALRTRGREMSITDDCLRLVFPLPHGGRPGGGLKQPHASIEEAPLPTSPRGGGVKKIPLADVAHGQWREDTDESLGLWLLDRHNRVLVHIDCPFLADQAEARIFLGWLRQHSAARFDVRWTPPPLAA